MEKVTLSRQSRSKIHFTTEGTEKVRTKHDAVRTRKLLLTPYCLLFFLTSAFSLRRNSTRFKRRLLLAVVNYSHVYYL